MILFENSVSPKTNIPKTSVSQSVPISKSLRYIFIIIQIFLSLDFGFIQTKSYKIKLLLKLWEFISSFILFSYVTTSFFPIIDSLHFWQSCVCVIYFMSVVVLLSSKYTYYDFQKDLNIFDREINVNSLSYRPEFKIIAVVTLLIGQILVRHLILYLLASSAFRFDVIFTFLSFGVDFTRVTYTFVFSTTCWRIEEFIAYVKRGNVDIVVCQYLYKHIADVSEKAKGNYNLLYIVTLVYNSVTIFIHILLPIAQGFKLNYLFLADVICVVLKNLLIMFAPCLTAGQLTSQVEKLQLVLCNKVVETNDKQQKTDLNRFIRYVEIRPMKITIWRIVPLDWNLPVIFLHMSFTYLVVLIQFTNKY